MARRIWYAEDIALAFEMKASGKSHAEIGEQFGVSKNLMSVMLSRAARMGFDAYPKRDK